MSESNKTEEFLQKLAPCIKRGELEKCVEEAARVAREMGISASDMFGLSGQAGIAGIHILAYVLAGAAAQGLEGKERAGAHFNAGLAAKYLGNVENAEQQYKKAIEADPIDVKAHLNYAILLKELKRDDEAKEQSKLAIEADPKDAMAHYNYAILLKELKRMDEAEEQYKLAIEADPIDVKAHYNYGLLLEELNRKDEAEEQYKLAIVADPKHALSRNNYANLLRIKTMFSDAEKEIRIALQIEPTNPYSLGTLGDILSDEEYYEEAEIEYKKALQNSASMETYTVSEIHNNLGYAYAQLKQYNKAKNEFKKAITFEPLNVKAIRNLRKVGKIGITSEFSKIQICLAVVLLLSLSVSFYLFWINRFSETMFATQSSFLIALLVFIFLYHQLAKFKAGPFEFEKGTGHKLIEAKSQPSEFEH